MDKVVFGAILTAAFLATGLEISNYFCCNSYIVEGSNGFEMSMKKIIQFDTATT